MKITQDNGEYNSDYAGKGLLHKNPQRRFDCDGAAKCDMRNPSGQASSWKKRSTKV